MFQSFDLPDHTAHAAARLARLREAMRAAGVDAFLVPRADAHQGENVAARDERLAWLTGFTGSAGFCVATLDRAAVFVDGRYTLQARAQVDAAAFEVVALADAAPEAWLAQALRPGAVVGLDPMLHPAAATRKFAEAAERAGASLRHLDRNLIDAVWADQPPPPTGAVHPHPEALSGEASAAKRARLAATLAEAGTDAAVLTLPDSIAWLLNVRGDDVPRMPAPLAFAILRADAGVALFIDPDKIGAATLAHLGADVTVAPPQDFGPALDALAGRAALVDPDSAPVWVVRRLEAAGARVVARRDPCILPKAIKNAVELDGARAAHRRDGAAMAAFLRWLDEAAVSGGLTETAVVRRLEAFRAETGRLRDIAFDTICGAGADGAIVHYRVTRATDRAVVPGELLLVDSGAQYQDGTTDVTRTVAVGPVDPLARRLFTLVLKGMIAVSRARFPARTAGRELDPLARAALWAAGYDYDHGTGHGVGSYLGVHEGPQSLSRRGAEPLTAGMILSNEPGVYLEGRFGIRIENLLIVTPPQAIEGGERPMMGFETLTLVPIDRRLIDPALLDAGERGWLDAYHARVLDEIGPLVDGTTRAWLAAACAPLEGNGNGGEDMLISIEPVEGVVVVRAGGAVLGETRGAVSVRVGDAGPTLFIPPADFESAFLDPSDTVEERAPFGTATHFHLALKSGRLADAAWAFDAPGKGAQAVSGWLTFDTDRVAVERLG
jgi:Xaa-Pro aminopeptidase